MNYMKKSSKIYAEICLRRDNFDMTCNQTFSTLD